MTGAGQVQGLQAEQAGQEGYPTVPHGPVLAQVQHPQLPQRPQVPQTPTPGRTHTRWQRLWEQVYIRFPQVYINSPTPNTLST